jgi:hypothetical protein
MSDNSALLMLDQPCNLAVDWVAEQARRVGLTILRTFDLQMVRHDQTSCPCPHHGSDLCDCQMVVLFVYQVHKQPLAIIAHGYEGQTRFSVVNTPQQRADTHLEEAIRHLIASGSAVPTQVHKVAHNIPNKSDVP